MIDTLNIAGHGLRQALEAFESNTRRIARDEHLETLAEDLTLAQIDSAAAAANARVVQAADETLGTLLDTFA